MKPLAVEMVVDAPPIEIGPAGNPKASKVALALAVGAILAYVSVTVFESVVPPDIVCVPENVRFGVIVAGRFKVTDPTLPDAVIAPAVPERLVTATVGNEVGCHVFEALYRTVAVPGATPVGELFPGPAEIMAELAVGQVIEALYPGIVKPVGRVVDSEGTPAPLVTRTALLTTGAKPLTAFVLVA